MEKNPPAMKETQVRSLAGEDPLEKKMATHSQYSCLENAMDTGDWQAIVHGVAKSLYTVFKNLYLDTYFKVFFFFLNLLFNILLCISSVICTLVLSVYPRPLLTQTMMRIAILSIQQLVPLTLENMGLVPNHSSLSFFSSRSMNASPRSLPLWSFCGPRNPLYPNFTLL